MSVHIKKVQGGITAVRGIEAAGVHCGLKKSGENDLALLYSREPAAAAGVFTTNKFRAARQKQSRPPGRGSSWRCRRPHKLCVKLR
jgi:glutamate N-acetyltransferase/amino-acid N-acetyltransferase